MQEGAYGNERFDATGAGLKKSKPSSSPTGGLTQTLSWMIIARSLSRESGTPRRYSGSDIRDPDPGRGRSDCPSCVSMSAMFEK